MPKWLISAFVICVLGGVGLILHFGIQPRTVRVIRPSSFTSMSELGTVIAQVLRPRVTGKVSSVHLVFNFWPVEYIHSISDPILKSVPGAVVSSTDSMAPAEGEGKVTFVRLDSLSSDAEMTRSNCLDDKFSIGDQLNCLAVWQLQDLRYSRRLKWDRIVAVMHLIHDRYYAVFVHFPESLAEPAN